MMNSKNYNNAKRNVNKAINSAFNKNSSLIKKNVVSTNFSWKNLDSKKIIKIVAVIILVIIVLYFLIKLGIYYFTNCYEKKTLGNYLFDITNYDVCIQKYEPIKIPEKKPVVKPIRVPSLFDSPKKEVFHIANQDYTYEQSKCKCASYGGRLATKSELTQAYNNGASWCTYGWADGQNAFYPVQKCDWDKINMENKRLPNKKKKYCGLPGINGGFFPNPELKFGATCYGVKPKGALVNPKAPKCEEPAFCSLTQNFQASNKLDTDEITGFNALKWNEK